MKFRPTPLNGVHIVELDIRADERGHFARTYDPDALAAAGIGWRGVVQSSLSFNSAAGTLRGMHFQSAPHGEVKLIRCARGAFYDVLVDPATREWFGVELREGDGRMLCVGREYAHGFVTLEDETEVLYVMDAPYVAEAASGLRWDDPALGIEWPREPAVVNERDASWPLV